MNEKQPILGDLLIRNKAAHYLMPVRAGANSPCFIKHNGSAAELAYPFLKAAMEELGATPEQQRALPHVFSKDSVLQRELIIGEAPVDFKNQSADVIFEQIVGRLHYVYLLIDPSLHKGHFPGGLANHDLEHHLREVAGGALGEVREWFQTASPELRENFDQHTEELIAVTVGLTHDLFQIFSRKLHAMGSMDIVFTLMPELKDMLQGSDRRWNYFATQVRLGLVLHDEAMANMKMRCLQEKYGDEELFYRHVLSYFGVGNLCVLKRDKENAVGFDRVPVEYSGLVLKNLLEDPHNELSLQVRPGEAEAGIDEVLNFSPGLSRDEEIKILHGCGKDLIVSKSNGQHEVRVSQDTHTLHEKGIPHLLVWFSKFAGIHTPRLAAKLKAFFALYPERDNWTLEVRDHTSWEGKGFRSTIKVVFEREQLDTQIDELAKLGYNREATGIMKKMPHSLINLAASINQGITEVFGSQFLLSHEIEHHLLPGATLYIELKNGTVEALNQSLRNLRDLYEVKNGRVKRRSKYA